MVSIIIAWRYDHIIFSYFLIILVTFSRFWSYLTLMKRWLQIVHDKIYINFNKACFITRHHFLNAYGLCNFIATEMKSASDIETTLTYPSLILSFQNVLFSKVKIPTNEIKRGRYKKLFFLHNVRMCYFKMKASVHQVTYNRTSVSYLKRQRA